MVALQGVNRGDGRESVPQRPGGHGTQCLDVANGAHQRLRGRRQWARPRLRAELRKALPPVDVLNRRRGLVGGLEEGSSFRHAGTGPEPRTRYSVEKPLPADATGDGIAPSPWNRNAATSLFGQGADVPLVPWVKTPSAAGSTS